VGFPAERTVNLNYAAAGALVTTAGTLVSAQFRLNSAYDPDYTFTGHQPMGYDQWTLFYNHYVVEKCAYEVQVATPEGYQIHALTHLSDDATISTDKNELAEQGAMYNLGVPNTPAHIFKGQVHMNRFFNRASPATDSALRAAVNANPTEEAFLSILGQPADETTSVTIRYFVKMTMTVRFMEPKDLGASLLKRPSAQPDDLVLVKRSDANKLGVKYPTLPADAN